MKKIIFFFLLIASINVQAQTVAQLKKTIAEDLKSTELTLYASNKPLESGRLFCVEVHATFNDGSDVVVNESGSYTKYEGLFEYEVTNARPGFSSDDSPLFYFHFCDQSKQSSIQVKVRLKGTTKWIAEKSFSYNCFPDPAIEKARLAKVKEEKEKKEKEQAFANTVASFSSEEKKMVQHLLANGIKSTRQEAEKEVIQIRNRQAVLNSVQYWKNEPVVAVDKGNLDKTYMLKSTDTLHTFNEYHKNIGVLGDQGKILRLTSYTNDPAPDEHGSVKSIGVQMFEHSQGAYATPKAKGISCHDFEERSKATIVNFRKLESGGYIVVNLDMIVIYDENFEVKHEIKSTFKTRGKKFMDAIRIPNTDDFAVLYTTPDLRLYVARYYTQKKMFNIDGLWVITIGESDLTGIKVPYTNRLFTSDGETFTVFSNRYKADFSCIAKYKFSDLEAPPRYIKKHVILQTPVFFKKFSDIYFVSMSRLPNGKIMLLRTGRQFESAFDIDELRRNDIDITVNSTEELMSSIKNYQDHQIVANERSKFLYPQEDGSLILYGLGDYESGFKSQFLISYYDKDFNFVATYKLPLPLRVELEVFDYGVNTSAYVFKRSDPDYMYVSSAQFARSVGRDFDEDNGVFEYRYKDRPSVRNQEGVSFSRFENESSTINGEDYFWSKQSYDFHLDPSGRYLYMITPTTLQKIDLENVTLAKPFELKGDEYE